MHQGPPPIRSGGLIVICAKYDRAAVSHISGEDQFIVDSGFHPAHVDLDRTRLFYPFIECLRASAQFWNVGFFNLRKRFFD